MFLDTLASNCLSPILMIKPPIISSLITSVNSTSDFPFFLMYLRISDFVFSSIVQAVVKVTVSIFL